MQESSDQTTDLHESPFKAVPIWSLSDDLLSKLFTYVSPNDRFRLAEVCPRWAAVSRMDWTDIISLDLSPIPAENIGPIIQLCSKLQSIEAQDCELNVRSVAQNCRGQLKSLRLYRVSANTDAPATLQDTTLDSLCEAVMYELQSLPRLDEMVLHKLRLSVFELNAFLHCTPFSNLPASSARLQLSSRGLFGSYANANMFAGLSCLILEDDGIMPAAEGLDLFVYSSMAYLVRLTQLRELCLGSFFGGFIPQLAGRHIVKAFGRLEILCLDIRSASANVSKLEALFVSHPTLRILVITGEIEADAVETLIPPRRRYPNGLGSDPLPMLHVFIGGQIAQKIRFARAPNDAMEIHPITLPMPAFLEQPEVAAIFKGSWILEMIKKGAKSNARLWDYDARIAQSFLSGSLN